MTRHIRVKGQPKLTMCGAAPTLGDFGHARWLPERLRRLPDMCVDCVTAYEIEGAA